MRDAGKMLRALVAFCGIAFIVFATASMLVPSERGSVQASATAFLVGCAVAVAAARSHAEQSRRLERLERRLEAVESGQRAEPGGAPDRGGDK